VVVECGKCLEYPVCLHVLLFNIVVRMQRIMLMSTSLWRCTRKHMSQLYTQCLVRSNGYQPSMTSWNPPVSRVALGRPKKVRKRQVDESRDPKNPNRMRKFGARMKCSMCKGRGHNKKGMSNEKYPSKCCAAYPTSSQCEFINPYYPLFFIMYYMHTDSLTPYLTHLEQTQSTTSRTPTQATRTNPIPPPPLARTNPVPPPPRRRKTQRVAAIFGKSKPGPTIAIDLTEGDSDERGGPAI
jgi:hypothetical protein